MLRRDDLSLTYTVEISEDLLSWNSGLGFVIVTFIVPIDSEFEEIVTVRAVTPPQFVRLRIERND